MLYYTGIGARKTPKDVLELFEQIGGKLARCGFCLRSGAAPGADSAFEKGCSTGKKEIYLPWKNFNGSNSNNYYITKEAYEIGKKYYEMSGRSWDSLSIGVRKLMARNCYQVLGRNLNSPSEFVICWTPGGKKIGGTSQALRIAKDYNIKVFNFGNQKDKQDFYDYLENL